MTKNTMKTIAKKTVMKKTIVRTDDLTTRKELEQLSEVISVHSNSVTRTVHKCPVHRRHTAAARLSQPAPPLVPALADACMRARRRAGGVVGPRGRI